MNAETTYYDILGVAPNADADSVQRAYVRAMKANHPDRLGEEDEYATRRAQIINQAYSVLRDPEARRVYDQRLRGDVDGASSGQDAQGGPQADEEVQNESTFEERRRHREFMDGWVANGGYTAGEKQNLGNAERHSGPSGRPMWSTPKTVGGWLGWQWRSFAESVAAFWKGGLIVKLLAFVAFISVFSNVENLPGWWGENVDLVSAVAVAVGGLVLGLIQAVGRRPRGVRTGSSSVLMTLNGVPLAAAWVVVVTVLGWVSVLWVGLLMVGRIFGIRRTN